MGKRGPAKTPAKVKIARGTFRADRDAESVEFPSTDSPPKPEHLHRIASSEWDRLTPILVEKGLLTQADWIAWQLGFAAYNTWLNASEELSKDTYTYMTDRGYVGQNPLVNIVANAWSATLKFCREFGLTPSARSGLNIEAPAGEAEGDPIADMMRKRAK